MKTFFKESQRFTQWWLWLLMITLMLFPLVPTFYNLMVQGEDKTGEMPWESLVFYFGIMGFVVALFVLMELKTRIDDQYISFSYRPLFINKKIAWRDVKSVEVINYGFVGGWGVRLWTKFGTVYNVRGKHGLHIKLKNGKQMLLGTQKVEELRQLLTQFEASKAS